MRLILAGAVLATIAAPSAAKSTLTIPAAPALGSRIVLLHNQARAAAGVGPIYWDASLASAADAYAAELARSGRWGHSPISARRGQGENLWMGTRGAYSVDQMIGSWVAEARWFRPGLFPSVSRNGSWSAVGHYTQMIWRGSTRVGCGLRYSARYDYLVCRYSPAGNILGVIVP